MRTLKHLKSIINTLIKYLIHLLGYYSIKYFLRKPPILDRQKPYNIQYVCLAFRGDLVINFPAIAAIKEHFPNSRLTCWVRSYNEPLVKLHSAVDQSIIYDEFSNSVPKTIFDLLFSKKHRTFIDKLKKYDIYIDDSGYAFSALSGFFAKIPFRVGRNFQGFGFLNHYESPHDENMQLIERRLKPLKYLGINISLTDIVKPYFKLDPKRCKIVRDQIGIPSGEYFTIQPLTGWSAKNWGLEKYCKIVDEFSTLSGLNAVFLGSNSERPLIDQAIRQFGLHAFNAAGIAQLDQSAAIIAGAKLHFGGDSVGNQIAIAMGVRSLTIFGPTNPMLCAYLGTNNIAVRKRTRCTPKADKIYCCFDGGQGCRRISCMENLEGTEVFQVLVDFWFDKKLPPIVEL
jgi:ADP-heptose:LPS heptosyltransferase